MLFFSFFSYAFYQYKYYPGQLLKDAIVKAKAGDVKAQVLAGDIYLACAGGVVRPASGMIKRNGWEDSQLRLYGFMSFCNLDEGVKWYKTAAEAGDPQGQFNYALTLLEFPATEEKLAKSLHWFEKAAEQGNWEATYYLAERLQKSEPEKAVKWYRAAAKHGHVGAQRGLADLHEHGVGVKQDSAEAYYWSLVAIRNGALNGAHVEKYFSKLSDDQKSAARKRAEEWKPE